MIGAAASSPRSSSTTRTAPVQSALVKALFHLQSLQKPDGHWVGELQGDTILETEYILLLAFLGREQDDRVRRLANYVLQLQNAEGGWAIYPGGPTEISASVKAYFALKLAGHNPADDYMLRAKGAILRLGGAGRCNSFTKFYLALLGQLPYANCASVPPEMMLAPNWFYFNIHAMSSWTRTIVIPLSIFSACKPCRKLPEYLSIRELFVDDPMTPAWPCKPTSQWFSWTNFFLAVDWLYKKYERYGPAFVNEHAVTKARDWMIDHFRDSDGVGAIFPPMIYTVIALRCLHYADDSTEMLYAHKQLEDLMIEEGDTIRLQPCMSPVWDTALTLNALAAAGKTTDDPEIERATQWLLDREVRRPGDWSVANPILEPGGWFFEYRNGFYPDTDDTAMVLMALARTHPGRSDGHAWESPAIRRGLHWLLGMQNKDGGWAAFDRDINREILTKVPFADHNAMLDPSCPDITARVLEALGCFDYGPRHPQVSRALAFLEKTQEPEGCWIGRWGVNYLYGTWQVLVGLKQIGYDMQKPAVRRAVAWLKKVQQEDGSWGETCASYDDPSLKGQGEPTASQTAWALMGLIAAGERDSDAVQAGIEWLIRTQDEYGNWTEEPFTGTGFPKVFYLKYHLYRLYFPLMALARYREK